MKHFLTVEFNLLSRCKYINIVRIFPQSQAHMKQRVEIWRRDEGGMGVLLQSFCFAAWVQRPLRQTVTRVLHTAAVCAATLSVAFIKRDLTKKIYFLWVQWITVFPLNKHRPAEREEYYSILVYSNTKNSFQFFSSKNERWFNHFNVVINISVLFISRLLFQVVPRALKHSF